jgi:hypothetical protein
LSNRTTTKHQTAKEFLSQAFHIDHRINTKVFQLNSVRDLATKATGNLTGMPRTPVPSRMDDFITRAIDLEAEITIELEQLWEQKNQIAAVISMVENQESRTLLELRYICFKKWEVIAVDMFVNDRHVYKVHGNALREVDAILRASR